MSKAVFQPNLASQCEWDEERQFSFSYFTTSVTEVGSWPSGCTPHPGLAEVSDTQQPFPPCQKSPESLRVQAGALAGPSGDRVFCTGP